MRGTIVSFDSERALGVVRTERGEELTFDADSADRPFKVGAAVLCEARDCYDGERRVAKLRVLTDETPATVAPDYALADLVATAKHYGFLLGWKGSAAAAFAGGRSRAPLAAGLCELAYLYLVEDEERACSEGLLLWDWRIVNDTNDPFGDLLALAGAESDEYFDRYDGQSVLLARAGRPTQRLNLGGGLEPLITQVNRVLEERGSEKRIALFAFEGRAYLFYACSVLHLSPLARLGVLQVLEAPQVEAPLRDTSQGQRIAPPVAYAGDSWHVLPGTRAGRRESLHRGVDPRRRRRHHPERP